MSKLIFSTVLLLVTSFNVYAVSELTTKKSQVSLTIAESDFNCIDGIDHPHFPVYGRLTLELGDKKVTGVALENHSDLDVIFVPTITCNQIDSILSAESDSDGMIALTGEETISVSSYLGQVGPLKGKCLMRVSKTLLFELPALNSIGVNRPLRASSAFINVVDQRLCL